MRPALNALSGKHLHMEWAGALGFSAAFGVLWFVVMFLYFFVSLTLRAPTEEILRHEPTAEELVASPLCGFVAMEYYYLILNRTYLVFSAPEGLFGWKVCGPVSNANRLYFEPFAEMLNDPRFMRDKMGIQKLSKLRGGFFIPRSEIASVKINDKQKWGMGGVPHSGRILVRSTSGKTREFVLLGSVYSASIQEMIVNPK